MSHAPATLEVSTPPMAPLGPLALASGSPLGVPRYYLDVTLRRAPLPPVFGEWVLVERIIFESHDIAECISEAHQRIKGGVIEWHENTYRLSCAQLRQQADGWIKGQAESGHSDVWNLPEWRAKYILRPNVQREPRSQQ